MNRTGEAIGAGLFSHWLRASALGWLLGIGLVLGLALLWDLFGGEAQFMVGLGMGTGVGYLQARVLRNWIRSWGRWWVATVIGMGAPFVLHDFLRLSSVQIPASLPLLVVAGGLLTGLIQQNLLWPLSCRANWWWVASQVGWALPAGMIALGDSGLLGPWGAFMSLTAIFFGGGILGAVTGRVMVWIILDSAAQSPPEKSGLK